MTAGFIRCTPQRISKFRGPRAWPKPLLHTRSAITIIFRAKRATSGWGAFALGIPFSVAICPFCTPALVILLGVATGIGSPLFGATLLLAFALGRAVPIILGAWAIGWLESLKSLRHSQRIFEIIGALLLILSGLYMLNAYFYVIPALAA
ncbi:cytochrome c biogenesis CcdA family protein [Sulfuriferula plumbiphila]|uniref:cytochrome c biogenesis CcdA family protein n=1 Tax=Sulfuriferula plumbiphila TaxID=171865 RepID=UPI0011BFB5A0|nr:cytochrome c biogenesis protein CcdA [Sulfuriferula plumbiphila]